MPSASAAPPSAFSSLQLHDRDDSGEYPAFDASPVTTDDFYRRAEEVAALLAVDVAARDARNEIPYRAIQLLKDAGLVTAIGAKRWGGGGQSPEVGYKLQRIVARGDGSIGQLLAYHYLWSWTATAIGTPEQVEEEGRRYVENQYFYGAAVNPREDGKSLVFNGRKAFSTGSRVSDLTVLEGVLAGTDTHVFAIVESKQGGIVYGDDWKDVLGMRGTQSGSITITDVSVPWERALGFDENHQFVPLNGFNALLLPAIQLHFVNFYLGIAEGALAKATEYTKRNTRAWPFAGDVKQSATDEFYIQEIYGNLQSQLWGLEAQVDVLNARISTVLSLQPHRRASYTLDERGQLAVRIAAAKVTSTDIALEVTSKIYEVLGARSISFRAGFDHFWRNVRTHTLHDPVSHKRAEVGRYVVKGELPQPTWYT
ncbi:hypothetical protein JCM21900_005170 [Sporobolomyces salmonicolor]